MSNETYYISYSEKYPHNCTNNASETSVKGNSVFFIIVHPAQILIGATDFAALHGQEETTEGTA